VITIDPALSPTVTVQGTTVGTQNEATGSCSSTSTGDVVYVLTTTADQMITATVTPVGGWDAAVYIRTDCGDALSQLACSDIATPVATVKNAAAGTYYIWIDGDYSGDAGAFDLTVTLADPILAPTNDTCATAMALTSGVPHSSDTTDATDDYGTVDIFPTVCSGPLYGNQDGPDLVYTYTPTTTGTFLVELNAAFDSALWVTTGVCGTPDSFELSCMAASDSGNPEDVTVTGTVGTMYFIIVDSWAATAFGTYTITVTEQ
jgi:hypothetical protein